MHTLYVYIKKGKVYLLCSCLVLSFNKDKNVKDIDMSKLIHAKEIV